MGKFMQKWLPLLSPIFMSSFGKIPGPVFETAGYILRTDGHVKGDIKEPFAISGSKTPTRVTYSPALKSYQKI